MLLSFNPHTHTGCDCARDCMASQPGCFNPHTHTGCDLSLSLNLSLFQSTHPYRVWPDIVFLSFNFKRFNPHTHTGCDRQSVGYLSYRICFNPHTHTGCDTEMIRYMLRFSRFNPHTHTGCDLPLLHHLPLPKGFNPHTHTGCDLISRSSWLLSKLFQSTHPYRVWRCVMVLQQVQESFNPHTHTGCDQKVCLLIWFTP